MTSVTQELAFITSGVDELETYLLSSILYWRITGTSILQSLTIGNLLLAVKRARHLLQNSDQERQLTIDLSRMDEVKSNLRVAWQKKCKQEAHARLELLWNYLEDYDQSPQSEADQYAWQIRSRVIIELLGQEDPSLLSNLTRLPELDRMINSAWIPGEFCWEQILKNEFPREKFWYLHGRLKS